MTAENVSEAPGTGPTQPATATAPVRATGIGARIAQRGRKKRTAVAAPPEDAEQPTLGALNRHLSMVMQQLTAAHLTIGRVVAERDALRQHLADLHGVTLEEIPLPTIAEADLPPQKTTELIGSLKLEGDQLPRA